MSTTGLRDEPELKFTAISKRFGGTQALDGVTFEVSPGSVHALLGGNGSGKSTLIKILTGVYRADSGTVTIRGESTEAPRINPDWARAQNIRCVHQAVGTFRDMSVADNFALSATYGRGPLSPISDRKLNIEVQSVLERFGIDVSPRKKMSDLSPATQTMIAVARALRFDEGGTGILVLDEPTATLPLKEQARVLESIKHYQSLGHTVILVTHRLDEVLEVADHATFLRDGRLEETSDLSGIDEGDMIRRIAGMDPSDVARPPRTFTGQPRLEIRHVSVGPLHDISLSAHRGEIVGLAGLLGSGRSSLLTGLFGITHFTSGDVQLDGESLNAANPKQAIGLGIGYVSPERQYEGVFPEAAIRENITITNMWRHWRGAGLSKRAEQRYALQVAKRYNVVATSPEDPISSLSGGNQQKVMLARWIELTPKVLLLNEPTQGVDVGARAAIHELIRDAADDGMTVIVSSSDSRELAELCDRVVGLFRGQIRGEVTGGNLTTEACMELAYGRHSGNH